VTQGLGMGLDESAVNTIQSKWKFSPATVHKKPVRVMIAVDVPFLLHPVIP
jgi:Gram-negative bacterial TonB protein C-terminal